MYTSETDTFQARKENTFLDRYICDWPIKEFLKRRFNNQRSYHRRIEHANVKAAEDYGEMMKDLSNFGSDDENGNENENENGNEN